MDAKATQCPILAAIETDLRHWTERRRALKAFQSAIAKHDGKNADGLADQAVRDAADRISSLPHGFNNHPEYRVRAARSTRVDSRQIDADIRYATARIEALDDAGTYDYSGMIAALHAFNAERSKLGPNARNAWLVYAPRIA